MRIAYKFAFALMTLAIASCSSTSHTIRPTSPFTPALAHVFDDSVDYVQDIEGLGGHVATDWQGQIDGLSQSSDVIGIAQIETVVQGQDSDGARSYRLAANITRLLKGATPDDHRIQLRVSEGQTGFNTVDGKEARLQTGHFVLFAKWYTDGAGEVRAHWHLSPETEGLMARVRRASGIEDATIGHEVVVRQDGPEGQH